MSKTIEQYRQIVKVLKLQLLKIRQQNSTLSKTLGIAPENQTSSFSPRLQKLKNSSKEIAKHIYLFNLFAHKCELIGVTTEMIFRIADKNRDKNIRTEDLNEVMRRLKLRLDNVEIEKLLRVMTKGNKIEYSEYLEYINAFQINSEKYPANGQRTYPQICLIKFVEQAKAQNKNIDAKKLLKELNSNQRGPYVSFESFSSYGKQKLKLKDVEIVAAFFVLDAQTQCQIDQQLFVREVGKALSLIQKGVSSQSSYIRANNNNNGSKISVAQQKYQKDKDQKNDNWSMSDETGVEAGAKPSGKKKGPTTLQKGDLDTIVKEIKKLGISTNNLISKLLTNQQQKKLVKPFSLTDFYKSIQQINSKIQKKKVMQFFKSLDSSANGSVSSDQLLKLWIQGKQMSDPIDVMLKLLARHMKQVQCESYLSKFNTLSYKNEDVVTSSMLGNVFSGLQLDEEYLKLIQNNLPTKCTVQKLVDLMQTGGVKKQLKVFKPLSRKQYDNMSAAVKPLLPKQQKNWKKLIRIQEGSAQSTSKNQYWQTIFTDQWACWKYCLETASKLTSFWRDPQFGPNAGDPNGYRSIVGNESKVPPGFPMEDQIQWLTFQEMLAKQQGGTSEEVKLFSDNLVANDIVQGKIGDCWFVSSLSIITSNDQYVKGKSQKQCKTNPEAYTYGIHPIIFHIFRDFGLYVFKFFKSFKPVYVVVDDLFPVDKSNYKPIFARSPEPGLQWVAFLQKAYSKLHHTYQNMISGDISQGINDLTCALPIKEDISNEGEQELLKKMIKLSNQKQLMGCSINAPKKGEKGAKGKAEQRVKYQDELSGLFSGHAYSIGDLINLKVKDGDFDLMRVRNPWGHGEWVLDWSDRPSGSDPDYKKLQKYQRDLDKYYDEKIEREKKNRQDFSQITKYKPGDDGQFLINLKDFAKIYNNLFTGYNLSGKNYSLYTLNGKWDKSVPSGPCKAKNATPQEETRFVKDNYQFILDLKETTDVIMFLMQEDGRLYRGEAYPYKELCSGIIIFVFKLQGNQKNLPKYDSEKLVQKNLKFELRRQVNFWAKLQAGRYAVVPCKMSDAITELSFEFRIYTDRSINVRKQLGNTGDFTKEQVKVNKNYDTKSLGEISDIIFKRK